MHGGRGGEADGLADLAHARRVAALAQAGLDVVEDAALAGGELLVSCRLTVHAFVGARSNTRSHDGCSDRGALDDERLFVAYCEQLFANSAFADQRPDRVRQERRHRLATRGAPCCHHHFVRRPGARGATCRPTRRQAVCASAAGGRGSSCSSPCSCWPCSSGPATVLANRGGDPASTPAVRPATHATSSSRATRCGRSPTQFHGPFSRSRVPRPADRCQRRLAARGRAGRRPAAERRRASAVRRSSLAGDALSEVPRRRHQGDRLARGHRRRWPSAAAAPARPAPTASPPTSGWKRCRSSSSSATAAREPFDRAKIIAGVHRGLEGPAGDARPQVEALADRVEDQVRLHGPGGRRRPSSAWPCSSSCAASTRSPTSASPASTRTSTPRPTSSASWSCWRSCRAPEPTLPEPSCRRRTPAGEQEAVVFEDVGQAHPPRQRRRVRGQPGPVAAGELRRHRQVELVDQVGVEQRAVEPRSALGLDERRRRAAPAPPARSSWPTPARTDSIGRRRGVLRQDEEAGAAA